MVFDLDPGDGASIVECCVVAGHIMRELEQEGLESFAKTSGSKGLQLYSPVGPKSTWDEVRDHAHEIARKLESAHRDLVVSNMRKSLRQGRILIDWSQNHPAKTTVAVYSVRAMPRPTVSTPVTPEEVHRCAKQKKPQLLVFETSDVLRRVEQRGDLFAPLGTRQSSPRRSRRSTSSTTSEVEASPPRSKVRIPSAAAPRVARLMAAAWSDTSESPWAA